MEQTKANNQVIPFAGRAAAQGCARASNQTRIECALIATSNNVVFFPGCSERERSIISMIQQLLAQATERQTA